MRRIASCAEHDSRPRARMWHLLVPANEVNGNGAGGLNPHVITINIINYHRSFTIKLRGNMNFFAIADEKSAWEAEKKSIHMQVNGDFFFLNIFFNVNNEKFSISLLILKPVI